MSVKIRLKRLGKVRVPQYRIVIVDSRKKRDGKVIEEIGKYHPKEDPSFISVVSDRAQYWLGVGAQPSEAVAKLLKITGDWQTFKGISGAEGTLKTAEPKRSKLDVFNEALKDAHGEAGAGAGATTAKKAPAKKSAAKKAAADEPADEKSTDESSETPAAESKPAAKKAAAKKAAAEEPATEEPAAPVPADETPAGATADAEEAADKADGQAPEATEATADDAESSDS